MNNYFIPVNATAGTIIVALSQPVPAAPPSNIVSWAPHQASGSYYVAPNESRLQKRFKELEARWSDEVMACSSSSGIILNEAYQQIIGMGPAVLPLIFASMRRAPDHWFHALSSITGEDPTSDADAGDVEALTRSWLAWAHQNGYA